MSQPDTSRVELEPEVSELVGVEDYGDAYVARVCVDEIRAPVRVREMPTKTASIREVTVTTAGVQLVPRDPRRRRTWLTADAGILVGATQAAATSRTVLLPISATLAPFPYESLDELWAAVPATPGTAVTVLVITEQWAD